MKSSYERIPHLKRKCVGFFILNLALLCSVRAGEAPTKTVPIPESESIRSDKAGGSRDAAMPRKVLFFGNSITRHPPNEEVDWPNNWGMAASAEDKNYVHLVVNALSTASGAEVELMIQNGGPFEMGFENYDIKDLDAALKFHADLVVFAIGENANSLTSQEKKDQFEKKFDEIVVAFQKQNHPEIVIRSTFWAQTERDEILKRVAEQRGCAYVDLSDLASDVSNQAKTERDYSHDGVAIHPGDKGMQAIAEGILSAIKKEAHRGVH